MNSNYQFLDARAREAEAEAAAATLDNVRERALRSAAIWRSMAERAQKVEGDRARAEEDRLARRLEEGKQAAADAQDLAPDPDGNEG